MAEEQGGEGGPDLEGPREGGAAPAAMGLALGAAAQNPQVAEAAAAYLRAQRRMVEKQTEHLHEQRQLVLARLRLARFSDRVRAGLQTLTLCGALALAGVLGAVAWDAAHDHGLVVIDMQVPHELTERGETAPALTDDLLASMRRIRDQAIGVSLVKAEQVKRSDEDLFQAELGEGAISLHDIEHLLRSWLGHQHVLSGVLRQMPDGRLSLSLTLDGQALPSHSGAEAELADLTEASALEVMKLLSPLSAYWSYNAAGHGEQACAFLQQAVNGEIADIRDYANEEVVLAYCEADGAAAAARADAAARLAPEHILVHYIRFDLAQARGHAEEALHLARAAAGFRLSDQTERGRTGFAPARATMAAAAAVLLEDAQALDQLGKNRSVYDIQASLAIATQAGAMLRDAQVVPQMKLLASDLPGKFAAARAAWLYHSRRGDWDDAVIDARSLLTLEQTRPEGLMWRLWTEAKDKPALALALALGGGMAEAETLAAHFPADCYFCQRVQARLASVKGDHADADTHFAEALRQAPDLPQAEQEWGEALLARGNSAGALAKFQAASDKAPNWADPHAGAARALLKLGRAADAAAACDAAIRLDQPWAQLHRDCANVFAASGDVQRAAQEREEALRLDQPSQGL